MRVHFKHLSKGNWLDAQAGRTWDLIKPATDSSFDTLRQSGRGRETGAEGSLEYMDVKMSFIEGVS